MLLRIGINNVNMKKMLPIVNGESMISMRLIDFFVTSYSKQNRVTYNLVENNNKISTQSFSKCLLDHLGQSFFR